MRKNRRIFNDFLSEYVFYAKKLDKARSERRKKHYIDKLNAILIDFHVYLSYEERFFDDIEKKGNDDNDNIR